MVKLLTVLTFAESAAALLLGRPTRIATLAAPNASSRAQPGSHLQRSRRSPRHDGSQRQLNEASDDHNGLNGGTFAVAPRPASADRGLRRNLAGSSSRGHLLRQLVWVHARYIGGIPKVNHRAY